MPGTPTSILLDQPRTVDVPSIEDELSRLWSTGERGDRTGGSPFRACSLNLVVLTDQRERLDATERLIGDVTLEHPSRIFLVLYDRGSAAAGLEASVSVRCTVPEQGGTQVCCELITLRAGRADITRVPSVIASLHVPDVPSILVWKMPLGGHDPLLRLLAGLADRVVIDTSEEPDPVGTLRGWNTFMLDPDRRALGGDLAWTHLTAWRSAIARLFEPEAMRERLGAIEQVVVQYSVSRHPPHSGASQAVLLFSWLAARLGWSTVAPVAGRPGGLLTVTAGSGRTAVLLSAAPVGVAGEEPGGIERVRFAWTGGRSATFSSGTDHGSIQSRVDAGPDGAVESVLWVRDRDECAVLAGELEVLERDRIYEEAVLSMERLFGDLR